MVSALLVLSFVWPAACATAPEPAPESEVEPVTVGATSSDPGADAETEDDGTGEVMVLGVGVLRTEQGPATPRAAPPRRQPPANRSSATTPSTAPAFAAAEAAYRTMSAMSVGSTTPTTTMQETVAALVSDIERLMAALVEVDAAFAAAGQSGPALGSESLVRRADAHDQVAQRIREAFFAPPNDMEAQIARLPPESRETLRDQLRLRITEVLEDKAIPVFCRAAQIYGLAGAQARATAQLSDYGAEFLAGCARARR